MENSHFKKLFESYDELDQVIKNKELKIEKMKRSIYCTNRGLL